MWHNIPKIPLSKDKGGEYTIAHGQTPPEFEAAAFSLGTNQISDVVITASGYHLIKVLEKIPAKKMDYATVADNLKEALVEQKSARLAPAYLATLKKQAGVEILDPDLKASEEQAEPDPGAGAPATPAESSEGWGGLAKSAESYHSGVRHENTVRNHHSRCRLCGNGRRLGRGEKSADHQQTTATDTIFDFSNQLTTASASLDELRQVNLMLTNDLDASRQTLTTLSNQYVATSTSLSNTTVALKTAQDQIAELETQNQELDQRVADMTNTIDNLSTQISETQMKLVETETNNTFLESELKQQVAQRADLERKFNNLTQVRAQVRKLRDDLLVARRLQWMREGTDPGQQHKGAELLMARGAVTNRIVGPAHYDLNVEVSSDGSVQVVPAMTNAPATTNLSSP